jgi:hypothetical protein
MTRYSYDSQSICTLIINPDSTKLYQPFPHYEEEVSAPPLPPPCDFGCVWSEETEKPEAGQPIATDAMTTSEAGIQSTGTVTARRATYALAGQAVVVQQDSTFRYVLNDHLGSAISLCNSFNDFLQANQRMTNTRKKLSAFLFFYLVLLVLTGCQFGQPRLKTYHAQVAEMQLSYPADWEMMSVEEGQDETMEAFRFVDSRNRLLAQSGLRTEQSHGKPLLQAFRDHVQRELSSDVLEEIVQPFVVSVDGREQARAVFYYHHVVGMLPFADYRYFVAIELDNETIGVLGILVPTGGGLPIDIISENHRTVLDNPVATVLMDSFR